MRDPARNRLPKISFMFDSAMSLSLHTILSTLLTILELSAKAEDNENVLRSLHLLKFVVKIHCHCCEYDRQSFSFFPMKINLDLLAQYRFCFKFLINSYSLPIAYIFCQPTIV